MDHNNKIFMSNIYKSLSSDVKRRYVEKIERIKCDPYVLFNNKSNSIRWFDINNAYQSKIPPIHIVDIHNYFIFQKSKYTLDNFKALKSLDAYDNFVLGHVQYVKWILLHDCYVVLSEVLHSQKLKENVLKAWALLSQKGDILSAHCTCVAGLGETCSHVAATCFYLNFYYEKCIQSKSCTEEKAYWIQPSVYNGISLQKIKTMSYANAKTLKWKLITDETHKENINVKKFPPSLSILSERLSFLDKVYGINKNSSILKSVKPFCDSLAQSLDEFPKALNCLYKKDYEKLNLNELIDMSKNMNFSLSEKEVKEIENSIKKQSNSSNWFKYKKGRVTASHVKTICHIKSLNSNISVIKSICYPNKYKFETAATKWGCDHKRTGIAAYIKNQKLNHSNHVIKNCGLYVHNNYPFLGATPDCLVSCKCCGTGVIKVKCPHCLIHKDIKDLSYLQNMYLQHDHPYYYQVQTQLFCAKVNYCDFVVWSPKQEPYIERIFPNNEL